MKSATLIAMLLLSTSLGFAGISVKKPMSNPAPVLSDGSGPQPWCVPGGDPCN
jgi:hypothetical protein